MATKKEQSQESETRPSYLEGDVQWAASAKDTDTFHKTVLQEGVDLGGGDPANAPVVVTEDVVEDFQYPRTTRPARRLVAAAGTMTTRRLAEEQGVSAISDWSPEGDEPDNAVPQFSTPISTAEAVEGTSGQDSGDQGGDSGAPAAEEKPRATKSAASKGASK